MFQPGVIFKKVQLLALHQFAHVFFVLFSLSHSSRTTAPIVNVKVSFERAIIGDPIHAKSGLIHQLIVSFLSSLKIYGRYIMGITYFFKNFEIHFDPLSK